MKVFIREMPSKCELLSGFVALQFSTARLRSQLSCEDGGCRGGFGSRLCLQLLQKAAAAAATCLGASSGGGGMRGWNNIPYECQSTAKKLEESQHPLLGALEKKRPQEMLLDQAQPWPTAGEALHVPGMFPSRACPAAGPPPPPDSAPRLPSAARPKGSLTEGSHRQRSRGGPKQQGIDRASLAIVISGNPQVHSA